jgi:DtxR family Mn-dependent transcriptional regulator
MKVSASGQDYLEAILELYLDKGHIRSIDISEKLGVTRPSVNRAINVLKINGLVTHEKYSDIYLTNQGMRLAKAVKSRHLVLKKFLNEVLLVDEKTADEDACKMEHNISLETLEKLQNFVDTYLKGNS